MSKAQAQVISGTKKPQSRFHHQHQLIYRHIEVQDEAEEERVAAFQLKAHRSQPTHKVNQLHH